MALTRGHFHSCRRISEVACLDVPVLLQPPEVSGSGTPRCATSVPKSTMRCATSEPTECKDGVVEQAVLSRSIYQVEAHAVVTRLAERSSAELASVPRQPGSACDHTRYVKACGRTGAEITNSGCGPTHFKMFLRHLNATPSTTSSALRSGGGPRCAPRGAEAGALTLRRPLAFSG